MGREAHGSDRGTDDGSGGPSAEDDPPGAIGRVRATVADRLDPFGPILAMAALLSGAGWLLSATVGLPAALEGSRIFFQVVLAGAAMALLRNEIGLRTYGLFAPVIIAFIMLSVGPVWGLVLFVNVLVVTLAGHRALRPLQLSTAPRVAVLLSIAGITTSLAFAAADIGLLPGTINAEGVFFPTIIGAWYADRAAADVEERGWAAPAKRLLGTIVAVVAAYGVIATAPLVDWFMTTPVAWGVVLLAVAYVGSRPSFRLAEFRRFSGHFEGGAARGLAARATVTARSLAASLARLAGREVDSPPSTSEVLAMKRRNQLIEKYNPPHVRPAADDKAHVNRRLSGLDIPSPRTYAVIEETTDLDAMERAIADRDEFVLKPSQGYGGEGIVVVSGRTDGGGYDTSKGEMTERELLGHARRIVDGHYSGLETDGTAIVEEKLTSAQFMRDLHGEGVADVRVIVFQGYPLMAMTRLPTEASGGAANLHLGAVGVGLAVDDGTPLGAYQQSTDSELTAHPDTGASLTDFRVPNWDAVLETAVEAAAASGLGYTGVDVVLSEGNQPQVLEVNVRPGLGIQNTTGRGLFDRVEFLESLPTEFEFLPTDRKIELAREWAAADYDVPVPTAAALERAGRGGDRHGDGDDDRPDHEAAARTDDGPDRPIAAAVGASARGEDTRTAGGESESRGCEASSDAAADRTRDRDGDGDGDRSTHARDADRPVLADGGGTGWRRGVDPTATERDRSDRGRETTGADAETPDTVGDGDRDGDGTGRLARLADDPYVSGTVGIGCLAAAQLAGFPAVTVAFAAVAVGFVAALVVAAFGLGGTRA
jgi:alpha-L-glutamate ligase-like protein